MNKIIIFIISLCVSPTLLGSDSFSFLRGGNVNSELTGLLQTMQPQLYQTPLAQVQPVQVQTGITLVSSDTENFYIYAHEFDLIQELAPTIGNFIQDLEGTGFNTVPLNLVSSRTLELLMRLLQGAPRHEIVSTVAQFDEDVIETLFKEAHFLQFHFLTQILAEVRESRRLQEPEDRCYFQEESESEDLIESEEDEDSEENDSSGSEETDSFVEYILSHLDDVNSFVKLSDLEKFNEHLHKFKGKDLGRLIRFIYTKLMRHAGVQKKISSEGKEYADIHFLFLKMIDIEEDMRMEPSDIDPYAKQYLLSRDPKFLETFLFDVFSPENKKSVCLIPHSKSEKELCHFEGPLAEIFCYNEKVASIFDNLAKSLRNYIASLRPILSRLNSNNISFIEKSELLRTGNLQLQLYRHFLLQSSVKELEDYESIFSNTEPNLISAYLVFEFFQANILSHNRFYNSKPNGKCGRQICDERKEFAVETASYSGMILYEISAGLLLPFANQFLSVVGEEPRILKRMCENLKDCTLIQSKLNEKITSDTKKKTEQKKGVSKPAQNKKKNTKQTIQENQTPENRRQRRENSYTPSISTTSPSSATTAISTTSTTSSSTSTTKSDSLAKNTSPLSKTENCTPKSEKPAREKKERKHQHKKSAKDKEDAKKKKRAEALRIYQIEKELREKLFHKFQGTLSAQDAKKVREGLSSKNQILLALMFAQPTPNKVLTGSNQVDLAKAIQFQMNVLGGIEGDAGDFLDTIKDWLHVAHDSSDTGDKLPAHYVDILRMVFIMYGLAPEGWEPKTKEDRSAVKYL